jgi:hypothetical protein
MSEDIVYTVVTRAALKCAQAAKLIREAAALYREAGFDPYALDLAEAIIEGAR